MGRHDIPNNRHGEYTIMYNNERCEIVNSRSYYLSGQGVKDLLYSGVHVPYRFGGQCVQHLFRGVDSGRTYAFYVKPRKVTIR